jgi:hypothetical protein
VSAGSAQDTRFDGRAEEGRPRRRNGFRDWFKLSSEPISLHPYGPELEQTCRQESTEPIPLLAEGDAFNFRVFPTYMWRGYAHSRDELWDEILQLRGHARRKAVQLLRPIARTFAPHRARELEIAVNKRTDDDWWTISQQGRTYWVNLAVRAEPDELVQEQMRPYWEARIKAECDHELGLQRARQADELTRRWSTIFDNLEKDPRAAHAAKLSAEDFAAVFGSFIDARQKTVRDLLRLLRDAVDGHGEAGLGPSEYTRAWDAALKAFEHQYGLKLAEGD